VEEVKLAETSTAAVTQPAETGGGGDETIEETAAVEKITEAAGEDEERGRVTVVAGEGVSLN
jgi:hypothetical protein